MKNGWLETENLGFGDLLLSAKLADMTHTWITHQLAAAAEGRKQADPMKAR